MDQGLRRISVSNFKILGDVKIDLGRLNVLVGPNGSGKSTVLEVIQFLGDAARLQLVPAVTNHGGIDRLRTRAASKAAASPAPVVIEVNAVVTRYASDNAHDEYTLSFRPRRLVHRGDLQEFLARSESFRFKRYQGRGRRITLEGSKLHIVDRQKEGGKEQTSTLSVQGTASGLALLPQLGEAHGGAEVQKMQELFTTFRVFDVDAAAARSPTDVRHTSLLADASNLAGFLLHLHRNHPAVWADLQRDAREMIPGLQRIELRTIGGPSEQVTVDIVDRGRKGSTPLADASFGTVRSLSLLALLYDPNPPMLTCVEEIDHGLHPHVFDRLTELLRRASERTQFIIATHSPALVNRLKPEELIVCERDETTGLARIPAISLAEVKAIHKKSQYGLGELWFSGVLGGVPK